MTSTLPKRVRSALDLSSLLDLPSRFSLSPVSASLQNLTSKDKAAGGGEQAEAACVPGHMFLGQGDGVFSYHCLPSRRVSCNKDRVVLLQVQDGLLLKHIWFKRPLCEREMDRAAGRSLSASSKACRATRKRPVQGWDQGARRARKGCGLWAEGRDQAYQEVE